MSQILVRDLSPEVVEKLKLRAKRNRRSLAAEVRTILDQAVGSAGRAELLEFARQMRMASGPQTTDSTDLIREDRER
jgi:plasmid stability protein